MTANSDRWLHDTVLPEWVNGQDRMDRMLAPFGERLLRAAALLPGEHVLDIGCGTGSTTLAAQRAVGPAGEVTGVDISPLMLTAARRRVDARATGGTVRLVCADAASYPFRPQSYPAIISRFGVGHFTDPTAAFTNLHRAARPGGRLVFTEWAAREDNEWMTLVEGVADRILGPVRGHHRPDHHRQFATLDGLHSALADAGFTIATSAISNRLTVGDTVEDLITWFLQLPDAAFLSRIVEEDRARYLDALAAELHKHTDRRGVHLGATAWLVHAAVPSEPMPANAVEIR